MTCPHTLVTVPTGKGWIRAEVAECLLTMRLNVRDHTTIVFPRHVPYENNLQHCVNILLEGTYDYWLTMDVDNPPPSNVLDLIPLDKDILACPTPIWQRGSASWNVYTYNRTRDTHTPYPHTTQGLQRVDAVGTGCVLFARRVFEHPNLRYGAFQRVYQYGTVKVGPDLAFCARARKAGFEVWAHFDYPCAHYVERAVDVRPVLQAPPFMGDGEAPRIGGAAGNPVYRSEGYPHLHDVQR